MVELTAIAEGVENTNYRLETQDGASRRRFVLTLFEARTDTAFKTAWAAAMEEAAKAGRGAVSLDGRLIDIASIRMAEALIGKADAMARA